MAGLEAGVHLGPYGILTPIAAGGMGEVYKARDTRLNRFVVIKVLPEDPEQAPTRDQLVRRIEANRSHAKSQ
jgi:serine/threonine protein kinase